MFYLSLQVKAKFLRRAYSASWFGFPYLYPLFLTFSCSNSVVWIILFPHLKPFNSFPSHRKSQSLNFAHRAYMIWPLFSSLTRILPQYFLPPINHLPTPANFATTLAFFLHVLAFSHSTCWVICFQRKQ